MCSQFVNNSITVQAMQMEVMFGSVLSATDNIFLIFTSPAGAKYCHVCLCVCLSAMISPDAQALKRDLYQFLCTLPMSMAWSSSGVLTIGSIAYRPEGGDGSAQRGRLPCLIFAFGIR